MTEVSETDQRATGSFYINIDVTLQVPPYIILNIECVPNQF